MKDSRILREQCVPDGACEIERDEYVGQEDCGADVVVRWRGVLRQRTMFKEGRHVCD